MILDLSYLKSVLINESLFRNISITAAAAAAATSTSENLKFLCIPQDASCCIPGCEH